MGYYAHIPAFVVLKSEMKEFSSKSYYDYLVAQVWPTVSVPVQYLCAELEIMWGSEDEARPIFDSLVSRFTNAPEVDAVILPRGGHNYEFSLSADILWEKRKTFLQKLVIPT